MAEPLNTVYPLAAATEGVFVSFSLWIPFLATDAQLKAGADLCAATRGTVGVRPGFCSASLPTAGTDEVLERGEAAAGDACVMFAAVCTGEASEAGADPATSFDRGASSSDGQSGSDCTCIPSVGAAPAQALKALPVPLAADHAVSSESAATGGDLPAATEATDGQQDRVVQGFSAIGCLHAVSHPRLDDAEVGKAGAGEATTPGRA